MKLNKSRKLAPPLHRLAKPNRCWDDLSFQQKHEREAFPFFSSSLSSAFPPFTLPVDPTLKAQEEYCGQYHTTTLPRQQTNLDQRFRAGSGIMSSSISSSMYPFLHSLLQKAFSPLHPRDVPPKKNQSGTEHTAGKTSMKKLAHR